MQEPLESERQRVKDSTYESTTMTKMLTTTHTTALILRKTCSSEYQFDKIKGWWVNFNLHMDLMNKIHSTFQVLDLMTEDRAMKDNLMVYIM